MTPNMSNSISSNDQKLAASPKSNCSPAHENRSPFREISNESSAKSSPCNGCYIYFNATAILHFFIIYHNRFDG